LNPQSTIAHYRITAKLGEGGMGAVYRATDTKLSRDVAIKVLPDSFASDPDRLARFTREAHVLASLNHPNIAAIYGVEDRAIVMELVEGRTLTGRVAVDEAIPLIHQLIDALEYAHEKGVIHRDLKPANIKVTPEGRLKVLDFGLAKALSSETPAADPTSSSTVTMDATLAGLVMGTASYMSPEQARGLNLDKRTDIWSFGVVFYEMLTGTRLFGGGTNSDSIAAVLRSEPDFAPVPPRFHRLLRLCLTRDPRQRLRDISGARLLLEPPPPEPAVRRRPWGWIAAGLSGVALGVALAVAITRSSHAPAPASRPLLRFDADPVADENPSVQVSPDGTRIVFRAPSPDGGARLMTRALDQPEAVPIPNTEEAFNPIFSPDGNWLAFASGGKLRKLPLRGGPSIDLCDLSTMVGGSWGDDGNIVLAPGIRSPLFRVSANGGTPNQITKLDAARNEASHRMPWLLPGGKVVLFTAAPVGGAYDNADIVAQNLETGSRSLLHHGGYQPAYFGGPGGQGYLLFIHQETLYAMPMDRAKLEAREPPVPVLRGISADRTSGRAQWTFAPTGLLVYRQGGSTNLTTLQWIDSAGKARVLSPTPAVYGQPRVSPDGRRVLVWQDNNGNTDLFLYDVASGGVSRLTFTGHNGPPLWAPDGRHILCPAAPDVLFWMRSDGSGQLREIARYRGLPSAFTPDGTHLLFGLNSPNAGWDIMSMPWADPGSDQPKAGPVEPFLSTPANELMPDVSPDGHWIAYTSDESGKREIYVRPFPGSGGKWQVSQGGGAFPSWSPKGGELFYTGPNGAVMTVAYSVNGEAFTHGAPRVWFAQRISGNFGLRNYSLAPDGRHMAALLTSATSESPRPHFTFLVNFLDEVSRKVSHP